MRALLSLALFLTVTGCAVGPDYHVPRLEVPAHFVAPGTGAASGAPAPRPPALEVTSWWQALGDAELDSLVERAVRSNLDIQQALLRLQQARTYESVVAGHALPQIDATASQGRGTGSDLSRGRAGPALHSADNAAGLSHLDTLAGFDATWELDVFGGYRRAMQAARFDAEAAADARSAVVTAVIADVVRAYVDLRGRQRALAVLQRASGLLRDSRRIIEIRYQRGITNELDLALATRELDAVAAQVAPAEAQIRAAEYAIAVLLGEYPEALIGELDPHGAAPSIPGAVAPGTPLELLERRADIRAAERELAASTARVGVAVGALFPRVALVGSIGAQQGERALTGATVGEHIWSFGPAALWPLLDFGAIDAQVDIADLEARRRLVHYRQTILQAVREVDAALDAYGAAQGRLTELSGALLAAQRAVDLANERYTRGLTDFLNVVDAERQFYDIETQYLNAQTSQAEQFVELYRSLGGGWEQFQAVPGIRQPQPAVIAAVRRLLERETVADSPGGVRPPDAVRQPTAVPAP